MSKSTSACTRRKPSYEDDMTTKSTFDKKPKNQRATSVTSTTSPFISTAFLMLLTCSAVVAAHVDNDRSPPLHQHQDSAAKSQHSGKGSQRLHGLMFGHRLPPDHPHRQHRPPPESHKPSATVFSRQHGRVSRLRACGDRFWTSVRLYCNDCLKHDLEDGHSTTNGL